MILMLLTPLKLLLALWALLTGLAALLTLPGSVELLVLSVAALLPRRASTSSAALPSEAPFRLAVIIPAHNEELSLPSCLQSLLRAGRTGLGVDLHVDLYVIADNCSDGTARVAQAEGAHVLLRNNELERGKGYALRYAMDSLQPLTHDCVLIVDADTEVAPDFLLAAAQAIRRGAPAIQARYLTRNANESPRTRLMAFALRAFNVVRPLGRENLGLSAGIFGNGFGLSRDTLDAVPYDASSVVEDLEYHLALVRSGRRVHFLNHTTVFGEMPVKGKGVETQRSRWEGGRLRMIILKTPGLLHDLLHGKLRSLEPLFELLLLPLAFHVLLLLVALASPLPGVRTLAAAGVVIVLLHLAATISLADQPWSDLATLGRAPFYIAWKILLIPSLLRSAKSEQAWVRTSRNAELASEDATQPKPVPKDPNPRS
jgi:cellulose synthase/poly-beta-1,6-N-acetylglucosamine synthase-like glycosyltransferase